MRTLDVLKISLHNIFNNKVRTLITTVIVFVVSLLIMVICILGISFFKSINDAYIDLYEENGAIFQLQSYYNNEGDNHEWRGINDEEYSLVMEQFQPYPELVDNVAISNVYMGSNYLYDIDTALSKTQLDELYNSHDFYQKYSDSRITTSVFSSWGDLDTQSKGINYLKEGAHWTRDDEGSKKVWVSESFLINAASYGLYLSVNDYVVLSFDVWDHDAETNYVASERFRIAGVLLKSALVELRNDSDVFLDIVTVFNLMGNRVNLNSIIIINEPKIGYVFNDEYKKMHSIVRNINSSIEPSVDRSKARPRFRCDLVDYLNNVRIVGAVFIGASVFICFIILIISIGSVANSVVISVDKNKRFLGVMMAVGLKKKGVKNIVQYETLLIIMIATGLAYGIVRVFEQYLMPIIDYMMNLTGFTDSSQLVMPIYIPIATVLGFIIMALLFARKSLVKIVNMDVISVISEVS